MFTTLFAASRCAAEPIFASTLAQGLLFKMKTIFFSAFFFSLSLIQLKTRAAIFFECPGITDL